MCRSLCTAHVSCAWTRAGNSLIRRRLFLQGGGRFFTLPHIYSCFFSFFALSSVKARPVGTFHLPQMPIRPLTRSPEAIAVENRGRMPKNVRWGTSTWPKRALRIRLDSFFGPLLSSQFPVHGGPIASGAPERSGVSSSRLEPDYDSNPITISDTRRLARKGQIAHSFIVRAKRDRSSFSGPI